MSLLEGHREFPSVWLLHEDSTEDFAPGFVLFPLRQGEWRHTAFGIHLDQYLTKILTNWVLASLRLSWHMSLQQPQISYSLDLDYLAAFGAQSAQTWAHMAPLVFAAWEKTIHGHIFTSNYLWSSASFIEKSNETPANFRFEFSRTIGRH